MLTKIRFLILAFLATAVFLSASPKDAFATNSWGGYHWARTSNPFTLRLGDNLTSNWDPYLTSASSGWSTSNVLDTNIVTGNTSGRRCRATSGRVEVCNSAYGNNGWLGIAQVWVNGLHITQAATKMNDTYFNTAKYNTSAWKNMVMCQEIGHTFGLDHQDEIFNNANLGTCMDYTDDPSGLAKNQANNEHPNQHDYDELDIIYSHLDSFTTIKNTTKKLPFGQSILNSVMNGDFEKISEWGQQLKNNGRVALFRRDFGGGNKLFTFTIFAE